MMDTIPARPVNCGLRLDYFLASQQLFPPPASSTTTVAATSATTIVTTEATEVKKEDGSTVITAVTTTTETTVAKRKIVDEAQSPIIPSVYDSYILHEDTLGCSDHCPIVLIVRVK